MEHALLAPVSGFAVTAGLIGILIPFARRLGLIDHPDERKHHALPTPLVGGLGIYAGLLVSLILMGVPLATLGPLAAGATLLVAVSIRDDIRPLSPGVRLLFQCLAAGILVQWGGLTIDSLGNLLGQGPITLGPLAVPFTLFAVVGLINAINMLDGLDGLAGTVVVALMLPVLFYCLAIGSEPLASVLLATIVCILAFLLFNYRFPGRRAALTFMGDTGSTLLGFLLAWMTLTLFAHPETRFSPVAILWVVAFPVADTLVIMWRRRRRGLSVFKADHDHIHFVLRRAGFGVNATVLTIAGASALFAAVGTLASLAGVPEVWLSVGLVGYLLLHNRLMTSAWHLSKVFRQLLRLRKGKGSAPEPATATPPPDRMAGPAIEPRSGR